MRHHYPPRILLCQQTRMTLRTRPKWRPLLRTQRRDLSSPTIPQNTPTLDLRMRLLHLLQQRRNQRHSLVWICRTAHESSNAGELRRRLGRIGRDIGRGISEEVRHEDFKGAGVVGLRREIGGEDVSTAECLDEEAEDVVDEEDPAGCIWGAGHVWIWSVFEIGSKVEEEHETEHTGLYAVEFFVFSFGVVVITSSEADGWSRTACFA